MREQEDFFDQNDGTAKQIDNYEREIRERQARRRENRQEALARRKKQLHRRTAWCVALLLVLIVVCSGLLFAALRGGLNFMPSFNFGAGGAAPLTETTARAQPGETQAGEGEDTAETTAAETLTAPETKAVSELSAAELTERASGLAQQYDYEGALALLAEREDLQSEPAVSELKSRLETEKSQLQAYDITKVTHIFFHILVEDPSRTFLDTRQGKGYNSVMTTVTEFQKILQQLYERGFVLVSPHDLAGVVKDADGREHMAKKDIMLPPGKQALVISQDDVNYYEYMVGSGCASRLMLDEQGRVTAEYIDANGNATQGDYDLVPILDKFVAEHPDFSYRGCKAILALTGYNGVLGYRTDSSYDPNSPDFDSKNKPNEHLEEDKAYVKRLAQALKDDGYEFASHSWGHRDYGKISMEQLKEDSERWEKNVEPLLPEPCDTLIFPFGADIGDWHPYAADNERLVWLQQLGFRYFCNVDSAKYWVQLGDSYLRQGRRNVDGFRLWQDYNGEANRLSDLIDVKTVFDTRRPTPIDWQ